jgi:threonyl-tRNA synthetase
MCTSTDCPRRLQVFWHSSAHVLGAAIEAVFGAHLTIGPPLQVSKLTLEEHICITDWHRSPFLDATQNGFYYDSYMGDNSVPEESLKALEERAADLCKKKFPFQVSG